MPSTPFESRIQLHGHGHVWLERHSGTDQDIANSARVSVDNYSELHHGDCPMTNAKRADQTGCVCDDVQWYAEDGSHRDTLAGGDAGLVRKLLKDKHGTPFEDIFFKFDIKTMISVVREIHRHRVPWSYSEKSLRYVEADAEFYVPADGHVRRQVGTSMSYTYEPIEEASVVAATQGRMQMCYDTCMTAYRDMLADGVAKELARQVLPVGLFTHMKARTNLRGLMAFLELRNHPAAMQEIREIAEAMEALAFQVAPVAMGAFVDNGRVAP